MAREDLRYEPTPYDVLKALRFHSPDPSGRDQEPCTPAMLSWIIADDRGLQGPTGSVLKIGKLTQLLKDMAEAGFLVVKTSAEWAEQGRWTPSRRKDPLYTSVEKARLWEAADAATAKIENKE